ncbi:MAG: tetratricopeptide repeat protein [Chloroflexi bacterium]|nr:tetratricopeptide repeat protein [Chloroflexota bacterium]
MSERENLEQAIAALEAQRATLGDATVDTALAPMREKLAELQAQDIPTEQQRKQVTVLFADVSGFTALSETLDAEEVSDTMNALWQRIDAVIVEHGGMIDKHIGDAVMALWGVAQVREDDPEHAIRAALDMQAELVSFRDERDVQLVMRAGINTGPVLLGEVRAGEFTAIGDTVNLASCMEQAAPVGSVLITHDTYRHVRGIFDMMVQEPILVKGKIEPVRTYVVWQARPRAFNAGTRGIEGVETRIIGRATELITLREAFYDTVAPVTASAETRVVTIVGDAGVGKSRLLHEFDSWIKASFSYHELRQYTANFAPNQIIRLKGRTTPEMQNIPYSIIRDLFASRFDIRESDSTAIALEKFRARAAPVLEPDQADLVGHLVGFDFSASPAVRNLLDSGSFVQLAIADLTKYMRTITTIPTVIFLEDIHWANDSSLDLIDHIVMAIPNAPLLIVCLARPPLFERRPHWGEGHTVHARLDLKPLSKRSSRALVDEILQKVDHIPVTLRDLIVEGAEGNPFYVEELIKMLIEDGVIVRGEEKWCIELDRLADVRVPPTLTGILQARLDSLPPEEKMILQRASVVGRLFWDAVVAELTDDETEAEQVDVLLNAVKDRELIFRRERSAFTNAGEYIFKHAILREVVYDTVLLKLRRVYHKQVAQWLEVHAGERIDEYLSLIAGHYELSGGMAEAVAYLRRAGEEALRASAYRDAVRAFERALTLLPVASCDQETLLIHIGYALLRLGDYAEANQHLEHGLTLARQCDDDENCAAALDYLGIIARELGNFDEARSRFEESLILARRANDWIRIAHGLHELGWVDIRQGVYAMARDRLNESLTLSQALGDQRSVARALNGLGAVAMLLREPEEAKSCLMESITLAREMGDLCRVAEALNDLGETARTERDYAAARRHYQETLNISQEIGHQMLAAVSLGNLGHVAVALDDNSTAARYYRQGMQIMMDIGTVPMALESLAGFAGVLARAGQPERGIELLGLILCQPTLLEDTKVSIAEPILADLRAQLSPDVLEAALERGKTLDLEQVIAEILLDE